MGHESLRRNAMQLVTNLTNRRSLPEHEPLSVSNPNLENIRFTPKTGKGDRINPVESYRIS